MYWKFDLFAQGRNALKENWRDATTSASRKFIASFTGRDGLTYDVGRPMTLNNFDALEEWGLVFLVAVAGLMIALVLLSSWKKRKD